MKSKLKKMGNGDVFIKIVPKPERDVINGIAIKLSKSCYNERLCEPYAHTNIEKGKQVYFVSGKNGKHILKHWITI